MIDTSNWKEFRLDEVFVLIGGFYNKKPEHSVDGDIPFLAATENENGTTEFYSMEDILAWDKVGNPDNRIDGKIFPAPAIAVTVNGACCNAFYQSKEYTCSHDITSLRPKDGHTLTPCEGLFVCTVIQQEQYRWSYGRKPHDLQKLSAMVIKLPVTPFGEPDWQYMENFIQSLHHKPLTTKNMSCASAPLNVHNWKYYQLNELCTITMGNKMDFSAMNTDEPSVNFVGRSAENNGVMGRVDYVFDDNGQKIEPYPAGCITIALGGSLGSTYLQCEPFYTSQNVAVIEFDNNVSDYSKLFICALMHNESRYKYFPFGRELNTHIKTDFGFTVPVDLNGSPDWQFMENYIKSLPYGDRI